MIVVFSLVAIVTSLPIIAALSFRFYVSNKLEKPLGSYAPKVSVIVPCKGVDVGFNQNISAIFEQDYPDFEIVFVTATENDAAVPLLHRLIDYYAEIPAKLVHAGIPTNCSQMNNNIIKGVDNVREESEVFVRMDSDSRPHPQFIRYLVQPLESAEVGAVTGFRWYKPVKGGLGSWLRSAWNGGGISLLAFPWSAFTWGGGMAFTKSIFRECNIKEGWFNSLTDEFTLTSRVKARGLKVVFAPQCMSISHEDSTIRETIDWTNRQTLIMRVYGMSSWVSVFATHALANGFIFVGMIQLLLGLVGITSLSLLTLLFFSPLFAEWGYICLMISPLSKILSEEASQSVKKNLWKYLLVSPIASLVILYNSILSLKTRRVSWRGVVYELKSPNELIVIDNGFIKSDSVVKENQDTTIQQQA